MTKHECVVAVFYQYDESEIVDERAYHELVVEAVKSWNFWASQIKEAGLAARNKAKALKVADFYDFRKSVSADRFRYCPYCGKEIDWNLLKRKYCGTEN